MFNELWMGAYIALVIISGILIVWTMALISRSSYLGMDEPRWSQELRRGALAMIGVGFMIEARWHIDTGRQPWSAEILITVGLILYLSLAICATYIRMRRLKIKA